LIPKNRLAGEPQGGELRSAADQKPAYIGKLGHLGVEGDMALGIGLVGIYQFDIEFVDQIRKDLEIRGKVIYRHIPEYPVLPCGVGPAPNSIPQSRNQFPEYYGDKVGGGDNLAVQFIQMKPLVQGLFRQNFD
jgi:hypothetical protein